MVSAAPVPAGRSAIPAAEAAHKPCQRSCRGLMLLLNPHAEEQHRLRPGVPVWRTAEPICLGLSSTTSVSPVAVQKLQEARQSALEPESHISLAVVAGHSAWLTSSSGQGAPVANSLPPGCVTGIELLRIYTPQQAASPPEAAAAASAEAASPPAIPSAIASAFSSMGAFIGSFRFLTSSASANAHVMKTLQQLSSFDVQQYADKFQSQATKNYNSMRKWMRELQDAVSAPKE